MAEDKSAEPTRISRRGFLRLTGTSLAGAALIAACRKAGIAPGQETCQYDNDPGGFLIKEFLIDAREYGIWQNLVGKENPHAEEGLSLIFFGGIYFPPEIKNFTIVPSFRMQYPESSIITYPVSNEPANTAVEKNPEAGGVLVINPVVVEGATADIQLSENKFLVPPPYGGALENLKDIQHMWVAMATRPLMKADIIGHSPMSKATLAKGSAVTFANINLGKMVTLIPPAGETGGRPGTYDDTGGYWGYVRLIGSYSSSQGPVDFVDPGEKAVRWEGLAIPTRANSSGKMCYIRAGEVRTVRDEAEARDIMAKLENPLR